MTSKRRALILTLLTFLAVQISWCITIWTIWNRTNTKVHVGPIPATPQPMGASGTNFLGTQYLDNYDALFEGASTAQKNYVQAYTCKSVDNWAVTSNAELDGFWGSVIFDYDAVDASLSCDGGICSSFLSSFIAADYHGGQMCQMGGSVCANLDGGGIDQPQLSFPPGNVTHFGGTENLIWVAATKQLELVACAGSQAAWASGRISGIKNGRQDGGPPPIIPDSGPPTNIDTVAPYMASAAGSPVGDIVLSATGIGSAIGVTFGGVAGTIAAVIDANHIATTAPACTGLTVPSCTASNGAATNVAISVSMPSGPPITTTGTGLSLFRYVAQGFDFYVSAQTNVIGDAGAGVVGTLTDHSGNGYDAIPVTPPPWVATGGGTAGDFPYVQFPDRVTDWRIYNSAYPAQIGGIGGWFTAVRATDVSALDIATLGFSASNLQLTQYSGASSQISIYNGSFVGPISASSVGVDFFVESDFNGSGSSGISVNGGSVTTGSAGTASSTIGYIIGGDGLLVGYGWIGFWYQTLHYPAPLTGAAKDNVNAAFAAVFP